MSGQAVWADPLVYDRVEVTGGAFHLIPRGGCPTHMLDTQCRCGPRWEYDTPDGAVLKHQLWAGPA